MATGWLVPPRPRLRARPQHDDLGAALAAAQQHQVVAMDHLVAAAKPQQLRDLRRAAPHDAGGVGVGVGGNRAHPESLERLMPDPALKPKVLKGVAMAKQAKKMRVTSAAGTDLHIDMEGANVGGGCGISDEKGQIDYWPGGLCAFYPRPGAVTGTVVMVAGDINLTFKRYLSDPVHMQIERDCITEIHGPGMDADLMKSYFAAWQDPNAYYTSHLGWGMNPRARWDTLVMFDRNDTNGTEQRAFAGNFLFSTGSNRFANRFTEAHFDLPMRNCTIELDGQIVVEKGNLIPELA